MARQNRVTPFGKIVAVPERGTYFGNRGLLHDPEGRLRRTWRERRWIVCVLDFKGRRRTIMAPNRYTELFFLDEATSLAAGHRPCAECRRERFLAFRDLWSKVVSTGGHENHAPSAPSIDLRLHAERLEPGQSKRTYRANLDTIPPGVFITLDQDEPAEGDDARTPYLVREHSLAAWSPGGYHRFQPRPRDQVVTVLTPPSTVEVIRGGYTPALHPSAAAES